MFEDDAPNMPTMMVDASYLAGYDWTGTAWSAGQRVDEMMISPSCAISSG